MRRFRKSPWINLADIQTLKTRTKQYRVEACHGFDKCSHCDVKKHKSICAKVKCNTFGTGYMHCFVLKEIV